MATPGSAQWEPLEERLDRLMCGDFVPDTRSQAEPELPSDVICLVGKRYYVRLLVHLTATIHVDCLPDVHLCETAKLGPLLLWNELGGYFVRRISKLTMRYLLEP